jgi:protein-S-isoprenylcysteine O-methyltransferase Ste14
MSELRTLLIDLTSLCLDLVGLVWLVAAAYFAQRLPGSPRRKVLHFFRTLLPEPWLLVMLPAVFVLIRLVPHGTWRHLAFWNPVLAVLGMACVLASTGLMLWARWALGNMWAARPLVQEQHELRTDGPYGIVRHPIYSGFASFALGAMLVLGFAQMAAVFACTLLLVAWRVWAEERMMIATFGDRYRTYRRQVPALVPFPRPASYSGVT